MVDEIKIVDPREEKVEFDLDLHIHALLQNEPFFARVSRYVKKSATYSIPTAGVWLNKDTMNFELLYNPKFFHSLPKNQRLGVLMHEFYHIALAHCTGRKVEKVSHKIQNIAMDLAINGFPNVKDNLPSIACFPGKGPFADMPEGKTFEWYLKELLKKQKEQEKNKGKGQKSKDKNKGQGSGSDAEQDGESEPQDGEGQGMPDDSFDSHEGWMEESDEDESMNNAKQVAEQKMKDIIIKAGEECDKAQAEGKGDGWGSVSYEVRKQIKDALAHKLDPKTIFNYFCKTSIRATRKHRITKINRRWAYIHPGRAWERRAKIGIAVDQSGSVSDEMLEKIFSWMNGLAKYVDFTVIPFDDRVFEKQVYVWKKGEKRKRERVLQGGTNFDAPTKYANENDFDALIIYTDLCAPKPQRCNVPRMWITDKYHAQRPYFTTTERILVID